MTMWTVRDGTHLVCDTCGASTPFFEDWEDAVSWSQEHGWEYDHQTKENACMECQ